MRRKVEFELKSPLMCGGMRIADNFLESESFIRGSVLRAAFANDILLECPLADLPARNGELNFIEEKEPEGRCRDCPNRRICQSFSDMRFSFSYPSGSFPAPLTAKACKTAGLSHTLQDTVFKSGRLRCPDCQSGLGRMESLKGLIRAKEGGGYAGVPVSRVLTTHTAINYDTHTSEDGMLYMVKAMPEGLVYTAFIDDCGSGMLCEGRSVYIGKYSSAGMGKAVIRSVSDAPAVTAEGILTDIRAFQEKLGAQGKASLLFLSDAILDIPVSDEPLSREEYRAIWQKAVFGEPDGPVRISRVFAQTQLYSGYNTSRKWGEWKDSRPFLMIDKGTSVLLEIKDIDAAVTVLKDLAENGVGDRTKDGFGEVAVCHPVHRSGVKA